MYLVAMRKSLDRVRCAMYRYISVLPLHDRNPLRREAPASSNDEVDVENGEVTVSIHITTI